MLTGPSWLCSRSSLPSTNSRRGLSQAQSIHGSASGKRPEGCRPAIAGKADKSLQRHASSRADGRERRLIWHLPSLRLCVSARTNFFLRAETQKRREKGWRLRRGEESCRHRSIAFALELRSEEHTSELQSLMRISYAVFCLKKKKQIHENITDTPQV